MNVQNASPNGRHRLLLVDDDDAFRESMELEFGDRGYAVFGARNHREALQLAAAHRPEYAVVDLRLGGERGLEVLKDLKDRLPQLKAVILTGYGSIATAVEAVKLGAVHYLVKPVELDEIVEAFARGGSGDASVDPPEARPSLALHEREYIEHVLASTGGNISEAARRLGLHRQSLQRKLRKYPPRK
jgi:two-component system, response regulator RegA